MLNQLTKLLFIGQAASNPSTFDTQTTVYNFNKGKNISVTGNKENASILLKYYFASISCLISKPLFTISPNKVIIHLCYYNPIDWVSASFTGLNSKTITSKTARPSSTLIASMAGEGSNSPGADSIVKACAAVPNFKTIGYMLNQIFNKPVELELIPLRYPYHDSTILAQVIALNSKKYNFNRMMQKLFQKATIITKTYSSSTTPASFLNIAESQDASSGLAESLNNAKALNSLASTTKEGKSDAAQQLISPISQLTGIKVTIAGRLTTQRIVPKSTVKTAYKGQLSSALGGGKMSHKFIDSATFTSKNKIGAYTVRVQLGHKVSN
jgi:hypothetical protein